MIENNILEKASWCLGCINKPCSNACPMHTNIPSFIQKIKENRLEDTYNELINNNILSFVCSLVCSQENQCEGSCIRGINQTATEIGKLESYVNEWAYKNNVIPKIEATNINSNAKVAIVGAGPAGISCGFELAKNGVDVTIIDKNGFGGIPSYGIPDFRLPKEKTISIAKTILDNLNVKFIFGKELEKDFTISDLKNEYDYIFLGIGAEISTIYKLTDEEVQGIYDGNEFLRLYNENKINKEYGNAVVIGGGNVAMDVARAVNKYANKVSILYRRDETHMPANKSELYDAKEEGIDFIELTRVDSAIINDNKIVGVHCNKTEIIDHKAKDIEGETFDFECDSVFFAIGSKPNKKLLDSLGIELTDWGSIKVDENNKTSDDRIYAGGDVVDNKSVVCSALASGKNAAKAIIEIILSK